MHTGNLLCEVDSALCSFLNLSPDLNRHNKASKDLKAALIFFFAMPPPLLQQSV